MPDDEDAYTITVTVTCPGFTVDIDLTSILLDVVRTHLDSRIDTDGAHIRIQDVSDY